MRQRKEGRGGWDALAILGAGAPGGHVWCGGHYARTWKRHARGRVDVAAATSDVKSYILRWGLSLRDPTRPRQLNASDAGVRRRPLTRRATPDLCTRLAPVRGLGRERSGLEPTLSLAIGE